MATTRWIGQAQAVAQVDTVTIANTWAQNDTATLTINGKDLVITIGTLVTTDQVATTIKQAWENETLTDTSASYTPADGGQDFAEHSEITATVAASVVTLTHDTLGVPFTLTVTEATAGTGTATEATATAATGPNFWDNIDNWDTGAKPTAADDVVIDDTSVSILYALTEVLTVPTLTIGSGFTGTIGLPKTNPAGYLEYREDYLTISFTTITIGGDNIGQIGGNGSSRIKIDVGAVQTAVVVNSTGAGIEQGLEPVLLLGTHADNTIDVLDGSVGVAVFSGETSTFKTTRVEAGFLRFGEGVTLDGVGSTLINESGTVLVFDNNLLTVTNSGGTIFINGSATITTLTLKSGTCQYQSTGTITAATIGGGDGQALFDCGGSFGPRTITTLTVKPGLEINDPLRTITYTNTPVWDDEVNGWSAL